MRHFVGLSLAVAALTRSVGMPPTTAALVPPPGIGHATGTHFVSAVAAAVALAAIAVAADDDGYAAASAQVASGRWLHRHIGPTGFGWTRPDAS
jgi:hypothetical protein